MSLNLTYSNPNLYNVSSPPHGTPHSPELRVRHTAISTHPHGRDVRHLADVLDEAQHVKVEQP